MSYSTYEFTKAQECCDSNHDKIHYDKEAAFRNGNYRKVFHQEGTIGNFSIRLLEATDLGLSKANGEISSFVGFCLDTTTTSTSTKSVNSYVSPVVLKTNNPVWTNCQFDLPLHKGSFQDGEPIRILVRVEEDTALLEDMIPGISSIGGMGRLLGVGHLDVTKLCLGQHPITGRPVTSTLDAWVPIRLGKEQEPSVVLEALDEKLLLQKKIAGGNISTTENIPVSSFIGDKDTSYDAKATSGKVRVLITYQPHGMNPQRNDVVALEAFARQNLRTATCHSILPSLLPMYVIEVKEPWVLVKYKPSFEANTIHNYHGVMRIHRNAIFVIERKNLIDTSMNLVLQPAELILTTPLGRSAREILGPLMVTSKQLMMPALLSSKILWMAVSSGVAAARTAFFSEGSSSLTTTDGIRQRKHKTSEGNRIVRFV
mmetsp:Transcript_47352/g.54686  ORF Transcript_47352/g.54686 Transcript_47352/m.54686 type:complete len:428 (-) Transcript_47352:44-1327(-)